MALLVHEEFRLSLVRENPATYATDRWSITGKGNGQQELFEHQNKWRDAEIKLYTREVVCTEWDLKKPDKQCTGSGYAHKAHGECTGYATDRT